MLAAELARTWALPIVAVTDPSTPSVTSAPFYSYLSKPVTPLVLATALRNACEHTRLEREAAEAQRQLEQLNAIGIRLTAERDTDVLLELILTKAREITRSDAGSLYLVEEDASGRRPLGCRLEQTDSVSVPFAEFTLPISESSVAGYVALSGDVLHLDDAYVPAPSAPFRINAEFDAQVGYRTKSMLVVPMRTPAGD